MSETIHIPVLLNETLDLLVPALESKKGVFVDCTFGGGGHSGALLQRIRQTPSLQGIRIIGLDRDPDAIRRGHAKFAHELNSGRLTLHHRAFAEVREVLKEEAVYGLMADLGFSSDQLELAGRGFSFKSEDPLDLRMDPTRGSTALEFLNHAEESQIAKILWEYGEERYSRQIAALICKARAQEGLPARASEFAALVGRAVPRQYRYGRIHPSTRTFQALRIYLNEELSQLDALLRDVLDLLEVGGRVGMISFHSLEDRIVKQEFRDAVQSKRYAWVNKKPIEADEEELSRNSRARSAKLRVIERRQG